MRRWLTGVVVCSLMIGACGSDDVAPPAAVRLLFAGDLMLGRSVAAVVDLDPVGVFEPSVRVVVADADIAMVNLESPLTMRPFVADHPYDLRADPEAANVLARGGFDLAGLANNHAGDAGSDGIRDTVAALEAAGMVSVGSGSGDDAYRPALLEVDGLRIGVFAFDASGLGLAAGDDAGVASWGERAAAAVSDARDGVDVVVVGLHGGAAYVPRDPVLERIAEDLVAAGVDVVWGHGAHVVLPVVQSGSSVVATGLGNLLFDQSLPATRRGLLLEVMVTRHGVAAWRTGDVDHASGRVRFAGWHEPGSAAGLYAGEWWNVLDTEGIVAGIAATVPEFERGDVVAAGSGDVIPGDKDELVVSFRRPFRETLLNKGDPDRYTDALGRSAHVGVFDSDLRPRWIAGTLERPVARIAVCDGALAVAYDSLDDAAVVAVGAWVWNGFGFVGDGDLNGAAEIGCLDIDGDGTLEPVVAGRAVVP